MWKRMNKKKYHISSRGMLGALFIGNAIFILFFAIFTNVWYSMGVEGQYGTFFISSPFKTEVDHGLNDVMVKIDMGSDEDDKVSKTIELKDEKKDVALLTLISLIINLVLMFTFLVLGIICGLRLINGKIPAITGFIIAGCLLFPLIYYPIAYPNAIQKDSPEENDEMFGDLQVDFQDELLDSGKLGLSYFFACISLVILLISSFLFWGIEKRKYEKTKDDKGANLSMSPLQEEQEECLP